VTSEPNENPDNPDNPESPVNPDESFGGDIPELEDATEPLPSAEVVEDDETEIELDAAARSLTGNGSDADGNASEEKAIASEAASEDDELSDVAHISDEPVEEEKVRRSRRVGDWEHEPSAHNVVVELKRIENEVRQLLEGVDSRRKRRLGGTQRWHELEEDIIAWRFGGRVPEDSLRRLQELVTRRHFLYRHLEFLAATRPVMNS